MIGRKTNLFDRQVGDLFTSMTTKFEHFGLKLLSAEKSTVTYKTLLLVEDYSSETENFFILIVYEFLFYKSVQCKLSIKINKFLNQFSRLSYSRSMLNTFAINMHFTFSFYIKLQKQQIHAIFLKIMLSQESYSYDCCGFYMTLNLIYLTEP